MELLILAGLAYAGALHGKHKQTCRANTPVEYYETDVLTIDDAAANLVNIVDAHIKDETTVNNEQYKQMPFFKSERSQNTNTNVKDRRLATFTGVGMLEYDHKQEIEAPQPSSDFTNIYGSLFNPDMNRYQNSLSTSSHNNVSSVEQQHVGPGLGLKDGEAATGGFHQNYRIKPGNVNGYRKHNFEGRTITGKRPVDELQQNPTEFETSDRSTEPTTSYRGLDSAQSSVKGHMVHSDELIGCTNRSAAQQSSTGTITGPSGSYNQIVSTRNDCNLIVTNHHGNPNGHTQGRYTDGSYIIHSTERGSTGNVLNVAAPSKGTYTTGVVDSHTLRDQPSTEVNQLNLASTSVYAPTVDRSGYEAKPTQRFFPDAYIGNANQSNTNGGYVNQTTETRPTMRNSPAEVLHGPVNGTSFGTRQYKDVYTGSQCYNKKEQTLVSDYRPNSFVTSDQADTRQNVNAHFKNDDNWTNTKLNPTLLPNPDNSKTNLETNSVHKNKTDMMNTRDFGYAQMLLKNNPFAIDITQ
jgi:hypothetical protein